MSSTIFMIDAGNGLTALQRTDFDSEDLFQRLLADHPVVLGGACGRPDGGRLLLVRREAPVPEHEGARADGRWTTCSSTKMRSPYWSR